MVNSCGHGIMRACVMCFAEKLEVSEVRIRRLEKALRDIEGYKHMQKEDEYRHYIQVDIPSICWIALNGE